MSDTTLQQVARTACVTCHALTEEVAAAMERIENLKTERDMIRDYARDLEATISDLRKILEEAKQ